MVAIDGFLAVVVIRRNKYYAGSCAGNAACAYILGAIGNCLLESGLDNRALEFLSAAPKDGTMSLVAIEQTWKIISPSCGWHYETGLIWSVVGKRTKYATFHQSITGKS